MKFTFNFTPRKKITSIISLTVILSGLMMGLIGWPSIKTIMNLSNQIYGQRMELEKLYQRGQVLKQTLREYEEIRPSIPALNRVYLTKGNELDFITTLEEVALSSGVSHDIKLGATDPKKTTNQLAYQLQTGGSITGLIRYLAALESQDFYININTIRISSSLNNDVNVPSGNLSNSVLQAIILATSYFKI